MAEIPNAQTEEEVMFYDTDAGGVVSNIAYLRFVERARTRLGSTLGLDMVEAASRGLFAAVVRTEIDYHRPAVLGDVLDVSAEVESIERVRLWCRVSIVRRRDGAEIASCRQQVVLVQMPKGRPARIPSEWHERWPHLVKP